ncbi:hypothetical protein [Streptomyces noursei]
MIHEHPPHQELRDPGAENSAETWGDPPGSNHPRQTGRYQSNPPDNAGRPAHRRRLDINIDGHFELALYISPRLFRWCGGLCLTAVSATWYLVTHLH